MFGSLGNITFQVLNSPQKISSERGYHYEKLPVIEGTPAIEWIYDELEVIRLEFLFHQYFTNPTSAETALKAIASAHKAVPLVYGDGEHAGNFVIEKLSRTDVWRADNGLYVAIQMAAELLQYGGTLPVNAPTTVPNDTPALYGQTSTQTAKLSGTTLVKPPKIPALPVGMNGLKIPPQIPLFPQIPLLPFLPAVGGLPPTLTFAAFSLASASRWGS
jgi:phage protein U